MFGQLRAVRDQWTPFIPPKVKPTFRRNVNQQLQQPRYKRYPQGGAPPVMAGGISCDSHELIDISTTHTLVNLLVNQLRQLWCTTLQDTLR